MVLREPNTPPTRDLKFAGRRNYRPGREKCRSRLLGSRTIWPTISITGLYAPRPRRRKPCACQIRAIALWDSPVARAIDRVEHRAAFCGRTSRVLAITPAAISSVTFRGAPGRGSSVSPSNRRRMKRARHLPAVWGLTPNCSATILLAWPSAEARTIRLRSARGPTVRRRAQRCRVLRSSLVRISERLGLPRRATGRIILRISDSMSRLATVLATVPDRGAIKS